MELYTAINRAADYIERHPEAFSFLSTMIPEPCGMPGCALGWIGYFSGARKDYAETARDVLKIPACEECGEGSAHFEFYDRMTELAGSFNAWAHDASGCAKALRLYAEKYHKPRSLDPVLASMLKNMDSVLTEALTD